MGLIPMIGHRANMFETNSSSTHTFTIHGADDSMIDLDFLTEEELASGTITISTIDLFIVSKRQLNDVRIKMAYVFTDIVDGCKSINQLPVERCRWLSDLSSVIGEHTGLSVVYNFDHKQDCDNLGTELTHIIWKRGGNQPKNKLKRFIFNDESCITNHDT